ncbi:membrane protein involved in colicin uptake [Paenarthrobacter ilicis]|uniref:Membrane protein involved in colicin uptake n=1 Tax=Paenarthrobacter ilicis TaxID=43665 RepID=A0ABX0TRA8_9MICC|nr:hypothetical protein [Paenarthrobacter ilicis]NIJ03391.1 membrane protein involved in colicin uptake [Paenarthrobacter ilicis]
MAGKTRNSMMVQARRKTEELAAKRREREAELQSLATDFHASNLLAEAMVEEAERQAAELIAKAKQEAAAAAEEAKATIEKMLATGETRQGIAELLDVSVSYVRSIDVAATKKKASGAGSEESGGVRVDAGHDGSDH